MTIVLFNTARQQDVDGHLLRRTPDFQSVISNSLADHQACLPHEYYRQGSTKGIIMNKLTLVIVVVILLSGCASLDRNLATGAETARIEGIDEFWTDCFIHGPLPIDLSNYEGPKASDLLGILVGKRPESPFMGANSLVVDAGEVKILTVCRFDDPFGSIQKKARFNFTALAGHTYGFDFGNSGDCLYLLDATADRDLVCEPFFPGSYVDLSTGTDIAVIRSGAALSDKGDCKPNPEPGSVREVDLLDIDAGPITIDVTCAAANRLNIWGRRTASFDFVAETGRTYTFTAANKECIQLLDITAKEIEVACEPYA